ncbi:MAG: hypothetical protein L6E13_10350 [Firmicutes bacterium]|nr:hypothetical protein [Bacillota bacterium]
MPEKKRFLLRLDPRLYEVLERWAADEFRSVNAQIELLLWEAARRAGRLGRSVAPAAPGSPAPTGAANPAGPPAQDPGPPAESEPEPEPRPESGED